MYTTDVGFIPKKDVLDVQPPIRAGSTSPYYCSSFYRVQNPFRFSLIQNSITLNSITVDYASPFFVFSVDKFSFL